MIYRFAKFSIKRIEGVGPYYLVLKFATLAPCPIALPRRLE